LEVVTTHLWRGKRLARTQLAVVDDWVLLYTRDNHIRLASLQRGVLRIELQMSGLECGNYPVRGAMSPDGMYVACGSETGELLMWKATDGTTLPSNMVPKVQLAGPVMDVVWSTRHHLIACCALDDQAPPLLIFAGGDPNYTPPSLATLEHVSIVPELPLRFVSLTDAPKDEMAIVPNSIAPVAASHKWAMQWLNADDNPHSAIAAEEKRQMKERILAQLFEKKGVAELEQHFASVRALPGGI